MKSDIVGLSFLLCFSANAADWTPVFKHLEVGKNGDQGKTIASLTQGIFRSKGGFGIAEPVLLSKITF